MPSAVFLRAVNVGGANLCRPAVIAKQLSKFGVINIGAVGTFVVRKTAPPDILRAAIARQLPFTTEIMIVPGRELLELAASKPFAREPEGRDYTRFVTVLGGPPAVPELPLALPSKHEWLLKIMTIRGRFVVGMYRRQMKATRYLAKIETIVGVAGTTRSWNTIEKVVHLLDK